MNKEELLALRKAHKLHDLLETRFKKLLDKLYPDSYTLKEGYGITSGRTDTVTFTGKGKSIHMELIASKSMVDNDLVNLHQSSANIVIAILLDEKYDPDVAQTYFSSNAKDLFLRFWVSDILDPEKEERMLGRLEQLIQSLEKDEEYIEERVNTHLKEYILNDSEITFQMNLGIFPRKKIEVFGNTVDDEEMFKKFEPFGFGRAANPEGLMYGFTYNYSHNGKIFEGKAPAIESLFHTSLAIHQEGDIVFSLTTTGNIYTELAASNIIRISNPTFEFACALYSSLKFKGVVDIIVHFNGLKEMLWIQKGMENDPVSRMIRGRKFYENEVFPPIYTSPVENLFQESDKTAFFEALLAYLYRNTQDIPWK